METIYSRRLWGYPWACQVSAGSRCRWSWCGAAAAARWPPGPPRPPCRAPPRRAVTSRGCSPCLQLMATEVNWGSITRNPDINLCYASFYVSSNIAKISLRLPLTTELWHYVSTLNPFSVKQPCQQRWIKDGGWTIFFSCLQYFLVVLRQPPVTPHDWGLGPASAMRHRDTRLELMESCGQRKAKNNTTPSELVYQLWYLHTYLTIYLQYWIICVTLCLTTNWRFGNIFF